MGSCEDFQECSDEPWVDLKIFFGKVEFVFCDSIWKESVITDYNIRSRTDYSHC